MKKTLIITLLTWLFWPNIFSQTNNNIIFFGDTISSSFVFSNNLLLKKIENEQAVLNFYTQLNASNFNEVIVAIKNYKTKYSLDDWMYYQLIRRTAQAYYPKANNYECYTIFKWYLLVQSGYNAQLSLINQKLLLYVQSNDSIYDVPLFELSGKQYVCLNSHDFTKINFKDSSLKKINIQVLNASKVFSYKINNIPNFKEKHQVQKELFFSYHKRMNCIKITIDEQMDILFNNYPSVDFDMYFNIPISMQTYATLIPQLQKKTNKMSQQKGVDYLMKFTRNAFLFETDQKNFGKEKRLTPEQTLMNAYSDCDDRVALLYYLIKEIYNVPMLVILYPNHVVLAVHLQKNKGEFLVYKDKNYTFCEPTPQAINLPLGHLMPEYLNKAYKIGFEYLP